MGSALIYAPHHAAALLKVMDALLLSSAQGEGDDSDDRGGGGSGSGSGGGEDDSSKCSSKYIYSSNRPTRMRRKELVVIQIREREGFNSFVEDLRVKAAQVNGMNEINGTNEVTSENEMNEIHEMNEINVADGVPSMYNRCPYTDTCGGGGDKKVQRTKKVKGVKRRMSVTLTAVDPAVYKLAGQICSSNQTSSDNTVLKSFQVPARGFSNHDRNSDNNSDSHCSLLTTPRDQFFVLTAQVDFSYDD